jgi:hypothetical protein
LHRENFVMNKKNVFNYRLAQEKEDKDPTSKILPRPSSDLPPYLSSDAEKELFKKLESDAKRYRIMSGPNARSDWFSNTENALQYTQLNNLHKRIIDRILPGKYLPSSPAGSGDVSGGNTSDSSRLNNSEESSTGFNNSRSQAKSYEPYLQQVNDSLDGNNLLYLAAISSFGFPKELGKNVNNLYTENNRGIILSRLQEITNNHYIQTKFPNIPRQLDSAIGKLDLKIKDNIKSPDAATDGGSGAGNGPGDSPSDDRTTGRGGPLLSGAETPSPAPQLEVGSINTVAPDLDIDDNVSPDAKQILREIKTLKDLAKDDKESFLATFKTESKRISEYIESQKNLLTDPNYDDMMVIERKLRELNDVYLLTLKPIGVRKVGDSYFVKDPKDLLSDLELTLKYPNVYSVDDVKKIRDLIQSEVLNKSVVLNTDIWGQDAKELLKLKKLINLYNQKFPDAYIKQLVFVSRG